MKIKLFPLPHLPLSGVAVGILCALYLFPGLIGHDPWKHNDAINFGVIYGLLQHGHWLAPQLVGEPFVDWPPLYYWIAAIGAKALAGFLPLHDGARLTSGMIAAVFLALLATASRSLHGREAAAPAALVCIGCLGLLVPIHEMEPMVVLLAASAAFYVGLARIPTQPLTGGLWAGLGLGMGVLAAGFAALLTLVPLLVLLLLHPHWHTRTSRRGFAMTIAAAAPLVVLWLTLVAAQTPTGWSVLSTARVMHLAGNSLHRVPDLIELLAWFAWPALPLALWTVWLNRQRLAEPAIFLPLIGVATTLLGLAAFYEPRPLPALPLLVPLVLLAVPGVGRLRRGAANAFDWFGMMTFTLIAVVLWFGSIALTAGIPAQLARHLAKLEPGFVARTSVAVFAFAALFTLVWFWLIFAHPRSPWRAATHWAAGVVLMWLLLTTLWLPWIDYGKSYRGVVYALKQALPKNAPCIAGRGLGKAQRVSLEYFGGIVTVRAKTSAAAACPLLIEQTGTNASPPSGWRLLWEGHRPGDRSERLRLYQKEEAYAYFSPEKA